MQVPTTSATNPVLPTKLSIQDPLNTAPRFKPKTIPFQDRIDAGKKLGEKLIQVYGQELQNAVVKGCVRGGIVIAKAIVETLRENNISTSLDIVVCRKIGAPFSKEIGVGAITETGEVQFRTDRLTKHRIDPDSSKMQEIIKEEQKELARRIDLYRNQAPLTNLTDKVVLIADDGLANGVTAKAAVHSVRTLASNKQKRIIVAVPVLSSTGKAFLEKEAELAETDICFLEQVHLPKGHYWDIEDYYHNFNDVPDKQVTKIMEESRRLL